MGKKVDHAFNNTCSHKETRWQSVYNLAERLKKSVLTEMNTVFQLLCNTPFAGDVKGSSVSKSLEILGMDYPGVIS